MAIEHPLNAPGDFYVEQGCCMSCGVPESTAPTLFAWDGESHCYVSKQPSSSAELEAMIDAMSSSEVNCIRYRGHDIGLLTRLTENGEAQLFDAVRPPGIVPIVRDHVTFRLRDAALPIPSDEAIRLALEDFRRFLIAKGEPHRRWHVVVPRLQKRTIRFTWWEKKLHTVHFKALAQRPGYVLARHTSRTHPGGRSVSRLLHQWLTEFDARDIRWYTTDQWKAAGAGTSEPT